MIESSIVITVASKVVARVLGIYGLDGLEKLLLGKPDADERLAKLASIHSDLEAALQAVAELQESAKTSQREADGLQQAVARLQQDKKVAEELVKVPEEAFGRMLYRASAKGRGRGLIEGILIGFVTGFLSSLLAWYVTK